MITRTEIERLAAAANQLRPDWPIPSLVTYLSNNHAARAYRDLAVALAWIAADPDSKTPARLAEVGPWWIAAVADTTTRATPRPRRKCARCGSFARNPAGKCLDCDLQATADPTAPPAHTSRTEARQAIHATRADTTAPRARQDTHR